MREFGLHDVQSDSSAEDWAVDRLGYQVPRAEGLSRRLAALTIRPGSLLDRDDTATAYNNLTFEFERLVTSAIEPLGMLGKLLIHEGLPIYSGFTLMRSSIEASALANWLVEPKSSDGRIFRLLWLTMKNRRDTEAFLLPRNPKSPERTTKVLARLTELKDQRKSLRDRGLDRRFPNMSALLADQSQGWYKDELSPLDLWRACSGIAHANGAITMEILERRELPKVADGRGPVYHMTASWALTSLMYETSLVRIESAISRIEELSALD